MNIKKTPYSLGFLVTAAIMLSPMIGHAENAPAQAEPMPARGPIPFAVYDNDKNGTISEAEFNKAHEERMAAMAAQGRQMRNAANAPKFADFDKDGNGQLTQEELQNGQMMMMQKRHQMMMENRREMGRGPGMGPGMQPGMGMRRGAPTFAEFDLNKDGKITEAEFNEAVQKRRSQMRPRYPMR